MSPYPSKKLTKVTGDFGELLVSFLLLKKYEDKNLTVIRTGAEHLPYDLLIPHVARGTPLRNRRPSASKPEVGGRIRALGRIGCHGTIRESKKR